MIRIHGSLLMCLFPALLAIASPPMASGQDRTVVEGDTVRLHVTGMRRGGVGPPVVGVVSELGDPVVLSAEDARRATLAVADIVAVEVRDGTTHNAIVGLGLGAAVGFGVGAAAGSFAPMAIGAVGGAFVGYLFKSPRWVDARLPDP